MPRPRTQADTATYAGRVAESLYQLRISRGWTINQFQSQLNQEGADTPLSTLYAYERGKAQGGADMPVDLFPVIARVYGYKTVGGWLPDQ